MIQTAAFALIHGKKRAFYPLQKASVKIDSVCLSMRPVPGGSYNSLVQSVTIIYASGSGHTEWVVERVVGALAKALSSLKVKVIRAEQAKPENLLEGDLLLLASSTWNTGGIEGQLHPYMFALLNGAAKAVDLQKKPCAMIALGDDRYYYTVRASEHLRAFIMSHNGTLALDALAIINEPYNQEERIDSWTKKFVTVLQK